jgi:hypothetical protein
MQSIISKAAVALAFAGFSFGRSGCLQYTRRKAGTGE